MSGILNLSKNDVLDLTKKDPSLNNLILAGGWDVNTKRGLFGLVGSNFDLDLMAFLLDKNGKLLRNGHIYFGEKRGTGIRLHGDNLTGEGDGDDEQISLTLNQLPDNCHKVVFAVAIFNGASRNQSFGEVKNAYVRLLNQDNRDSEICRFNLTENGGSNTANIVCELERETSGWQFKAIGEYLKSDYAHLAKSFK